MSRNMRWILVMLAGCGIGSLVGADPEALAGAKIAVRDVWARSTAPGATSSEFYMVIVNSGDLADRLVSARSPGCGMLEPFEYQAGHQGMMSMRGMPDGIEVPLGRVELRVGGLHLMCMQKKEDLKAGARVPLTLHFREAGEVQTEIAIRDR